MGQMVQSALPPVLSLAAMAAGLDRLGMVLAVYAGSYAACCLLGLGFIARDWRGVLRGREAAGPGQAEALPGLWATARPFLVIELVQVSLLSAPVMVLGMVAQAAAVSAFSIASRLAMLINTMLVSVAMIAAPAFAAHHRRREFAALRRVEWQNRMMALAICTPVLAGMVAFAHPLLSLMASDRPGSAQVLWVLAIGQAVNILLPTQDMMLAMTGHGALLRRLNLHQMAACLLLCAALIPPFGMMGAAVVTSLGLVQGRVSFALGVRRVIPELRRVEGAWAG
jgi:O-antigen/teichoic acid export membrane protein